MNGLDALNNLPPHPLKLDRLPQPVSNFPNVHWYVGIALFPHRLRKKDSIESTYSSLGEKRHTRTAYFTVRCNYSPSWVSQEYFPVSVDLRQGGG